MTVVGGMGRLRGRDNDDKDSIGVYVHPEGCVTRCGTELPLGDNWFGCLGIMSGQVRRLLASTLYWHADPTYCNLHRSMGFFKCLDDNPLARPLTFPSNMPAFIVVGRADKLRRSIPAPTVKRGQSESNGLTLRYGLKSSSKNKQTSRYKSHHAKPASGT